MRDKRPVDELSVEELERILAVKRREERLHKLDRMKKHGRVLGDAPEQNASSGKQHPPEAAILALAQSPPAAAAPDAPARSAPVGGDVVPRFEESPVDIGLSTQEKTRFWKNFTNQVLLLVEIAAVLAVIYIAYMLFQSIGVLERETAEAQRQANEQRLAALPTIAPTPVLRLENFVLPGGHTPPTAPGGAQFNLNEIPENLLPVVQSQVFPEILRRPPPSPETALRVIIPKLNLNEGIVQGTDWEALKQGVGQLQNGVNPGDNAGNLVLSAHNDIYGELFRYLDQLEAGDRFQVQTQTQSYTYVVSGWDIYQPNDVHVLNSRGSATITLISCYPYQVSDKRIVVFADRVDT